MFAKLFFNLPDGSNRLEEVDMAYCDNQTLRQIVEIMISFAYLSPLCYTFRLGFYLISHALLQTGRALSIFKADLWEINHMSVENFA